MVFLEFNCGSPPFKLLRHLPDLNSTFEKCLSKPHITYQGRYTAVAGILYNTRGRNLEQTYDFAEFRKAVDLKLRTFMFLWLSVNTGFGQSVTSCIREFQGLFGFDESTWCFECIKKDFQRHHHDNQRINLGSFNKLKADRATAIIRDLVALGIVSKSYVKQLKYNAKNLTSDKAF